MTDSTVIQRGQALPVGALILPLLLAFSLKSGAAGLELVCPCAIESNGPTSMKITAGVRNTGAASGVLRLRVIGHPTPSFYGNAFSFVGEIPLPDTLPSGTEFPITVYKTGYSPPASEINHFTLQLEENTGSGWVRTDWVRMQQRARSVRTAGSAYYSGNVFFDGRVFSRIEDGEITLELPPIMNVSTSVASGDLSIQIWQQNAANFYSLRANIAMGTSLPPLTRLAATSVTRPYSELTEPGYDFFDVVLIGGNTLLASQRLYVKNGVPEQRFFALDSIDMLSDGDNDQVSDYNERLAGTDPADPDDMPGRATVRVLVYYSDEVPPLYGGDPIPRIEHLMDVANQVLDDSGADVALELAKAEEIVLTPGATNGQILGDMGAEAGAFSNLAGTRKSELVDIVLVMLPYADDGSCGIATLGGVGAGGVPYAGDFAPDFNAENANAVISINGPCSDTSAVHELGHVLGLGHSRAQGSFGTFEWSLGHGIPGQFVTVMPYRSAFANAPEVALFSTPELDCNPGQSCGVDRADSVNGADAVLSINTASHQVAAYTRDTDGDGIANALDDDDDGDGTPDAADEVPLDPNDITDTDLDGIGDYRDTDDDGDGLSDVEEGNRGTDPRLWDTDSDGVKDDEDAFPDNVAAAVDADADGLPDAWNPGCNTLCQGASGLTLDDDPNTAPAGECPDFVCRPFNRGWRAVILQRAGRT